MSDRRQSLALIASNSIARAVFAICKGMLSLARPSLLAVVAAIALCPAVAGADELTDDEVLVTDGRAIWRIGDPDTEPVEVVTLRVPAALVRRIQTSVDGSAAILDVDGHTAWVDLSAPPPTRPRYLPCSTAAQISAEGDRVVCGAPDGKRSVVYRLRPTLSHEIIDVSPTSVRFAGDDQQAIVTIGDQGIVRTDAGTAAVLAPHHPDSDFLVAPSGQRAAGTYLDDDIPTLFTFRLDGKGARRKLMTPGRPITFSRDSRWLVVQSDRRACVVRAVGGEYKCWNGFSALSASTHAKVLLMTRENDDDPARVDIFRARLDGPRSTPPRLFRAGVLGTAAFVAPAKVPSPDPTTIDPPGPGDVAAPGETPTASP